MDEIKILREKLDENGTYLAEFLNAHRDEGFCEATNAIINYAVSVIHMSLRAVVKEYRPIVLIEIINTLQTEQE